MLHLTAKGLWQPSIHRHPGEGRDLPPDTSMKDQFSVYILASLHNRVIYVGMTSDLPVRIWQHKTKVIKGFTAKYNVDRPCLVRNT